MTHYNSKNLLLQTVYDLLSKGPESSIHNLSAAELCLLGWISFHNIFHLHVYHQNSNALTVPVPQILVERRYQRTNRDLLDNLPSTPDNIKLSPKGSFWIALLQSGGTPETRNGLLEVQKAFHEAGLIFRKTVDLLPAAFQGIDIREMLAGAALMDEANRTTMSELHKIDAFPLTHVIVLKEIKRKNRHEKEEKNLRSSSEP
ncbi:hypothetical protein FXO37_10380 [Capsicum annuum]|nr:hypothetical protein FXO37_10380 [Capsicum annuum]